MKMLILGATGPTGRHLVDLALRSGDSVTALVRNPVTLGEVADRFTVVMGDATSQRDVAAAALGQDAIISALGQGKSLNPHELFDRASTAVIGAARQQGVSRLVWMSSFGVGATYESATVTQRTMYRTLLRRVYANKKIADDRIRSSGLDWTVVYPTALTNGPAKGTYRVDDRLQMKGAPRISRADVAAFMHRAAHSSEWIGRDAVITD
ncbi:NAD-dependent epimerase/dehydratase family protein [Streptomyces ipomoeae]|uniref:NAD-dependent epimerase/dehydratase family protein n=1 Tax=Streptomyces ipomoeae TaxID=103232 RepID=A0A540PZ48_9ACTN|nr:NAD(P)H-binding protein [Streptomyces ipomoeae]MDX2937200.1 NAD(P)H-binding protein [Streptomyces ipomoeae]TQE27901.1 NAD-dependent epimerase/dehydratase family protein [Streptomyces ipomoeae]TQE28550.1 NAD-dependent epimerase/dehydratase family protein [Streptomyces ipomoeae]TQE36235.1 NAD-dependent epimerase/dehydratase family protein [Streptomyces ipomoeae]